MCITLNHKGVPSRRSLNSNDLIVSACSYHIGSLKRYLHTRAGGEEARFNVQLPECRREPQSSSLKSKNPLSASPERIQVFQKSVKLQP